MISDGSFLELVCALSNDNHYVKNPIVLTSCVHTSCRMCLPRELNEEAKCKVCGIKITRNLDNDEESVAIKHYFRTSINDLINVVEKQTDTQIKKLESILNGY